MNGLNHCTFVFIFIDLIWRLWSVQKKDIFYNLGRNWTDHKLRKLAVFALSNTCAVVPGEGSLEKWVGRVFD